MKVCWALVCVAPLWLAVSLGEEESRSTPLSVSPDRKWEYRLINDKTPALFVAGVIEPSLKLERESKSFTEPGRIVWSPDSRRFAYNFRWGEHDQTADLYQLRGQKWLKLRSVQCNETTAPLERVAAKEIRKLKLPALISQRHVRDTWRVRKWLAPDTAILYAQTFRTVLLKGDEGRADIVANFLFTLKFDAEGNWKIVKAYQMSQDEAEQEETEPQ